MLAFLQNKSYSSLFILLYELTYNSLISKYEYQLSVWFIDTTILTCSLRVKKIIPILKWILLQQFKFYMLVINLNILLNGVIKIFKDIVCT